MHRRNHLLQIGEAHRLVEIAIGAQALAKGDMDINTCHLTHSAEIESADCKNVKKVSDSQDFGDEW
jgi:hypothetical protein